MARKEKLITCNMEVKKLPKLDRLLQKTKYIEVLYWKTRLV